MPSKTLLDANIILRFLTKDHEEHYLKAVTIFQNIENGEIVALVPDFILAEVVYVLKRIYKVDKHTIAQQLKKLLMYEHLYTNNHLVTLEALNIYANQNIDFADALLCAMKNLESYKVLSFDADITKC